MLSTGSQPHYAHRSNPFNLTPQSGPPLPNFVPDAPQTWSPDTPTWNPQLPPTNDYTAEVSPDYMWPTNLPVEVHSQYLYSSGNHTPVAANTMSPPSVHAYPTHVLPDVRSEPHFLDTHTQSPSHPLIWNDPALRVNQRASNDHPLPHIDSVTRSPFIPQSWDAHPNTGNEISFHTGSTLLVSHIPKHPFHSVRGAPEATQRGSLTPHGQSHLDDRSRDVVVRTVPYLISSHSYIHRYPLYQGDCSDSI